MAYDDDVWRMLWIRGRLAVLEKIAARRWKELKLQVQIDEAYERTKSEHAMYQAERRLHATVSEPVPTPDSTL